MSSKIEMMFEILKKEYDYIIVDTAPVSLLLILYCWQNMLMLICGSATTWTSKCLKFLNRCTVKRNCLICVFFT
jgi:anion-transporting  ArsA/GET3 family ATPase